MRHKKGRRGFCKAIGAMLFGGLATKVVKGRPETKEPDKTRVDTCGASGNGQYSIRCDLHNYGYDKPDDDKRKDWKLCRAIYTNDSCEYYIEGDAFSDARFRHELNWLKNGLHRDARFVAGSRIQGWLIGRVFHWKNGEVHIVKVLEGKKENLEYVLQTIAGTRTRGDRDI